MGGHASSDFTFLIRCSFEEGLGSHPTGKPGAEAGRGVGPNRGPTPTPQRALFLTAAAAELLFRDLDLLLRAFGLRRVGGELHRRLPFLDRVFELAAIGE